MILLDTHVLIWLAEDNPRLGKRAAHAADAALHRDELYVSAISFWELAMLHARNRLKLDRSAPAIRATILQQGMREVAIDGAIAIAAGQLAGFHGDPADRFVVASALALGAALLTADEQILNWHSGPRLLDARR
ncbi:MAG: type II toxin-antitoxin system VapC family toxin [Proteobacteria bacterium]|nr:type II toxin-antitoxin system VapC family toxin [Pseudomonadota bacterium]